METDGKLYYASSEYLIQGIVGNAGVVGDVSGLSMQDVNDIEQKTGARLYAPTSTASSVLTWLTSIRIMRGVWLLVLFIVTALLYCLSAGTGLRSLSYRLVMTSSPSTV